MALTKCKECGNEISSTAKACPKCGAKPPKRTSMFTKIVAGFFAFVFVVSIIASNQARQDNDKKAAAESTRVAALSPEQRALEQDAKAKATQEAAKEEKDRDARLKRAVSAMATIKQAARNPASIQWGSIRADESGATVCIEYRAQNGFGGMNIERATTIGQGLSTSVNDWNARCVRDLYVVAQAVDMLDYYERQRQ